MKNFHGFKPNHKMSHGGDLGGDGRKHQRIETMKYAKGGSVSSDRAAIAHQKNVGTKAAITGQMAAKKGMSQQPRRLAKGGSASSDRAAIAHQKNVATKAAITGQMAARKGMNQQTRRFAEGGSTSSSAMTEKQKKDAEKAAKEKEKAAKKNDKDKEKSNSKSSGSTSSSSTSTGSTSTGSSTSSTTGAKSSTMSIKDKKAAAEKKTSEKKAAKKKAKAAGPTAFAKWKAEQEAAKNKERADKEAAKKKDSSKEAEKALKEKEKAAKKAEKNKPKTTTTTTTTTPATTTTSPAANTSASNVSASPTTTSAKASEGISYAYVPHTKAEKLGASVVGRQLKKGGKVLKKANGGTIAVPMLRPDLIPGSPVSGKMPVDPYGPRGGRPAPGIRPVMGGDMRNPPALGQLPLGPGGVPIRKKIAGYKGGIDSLGRGVYDAAPPRATALKKGGAAKGGKWIQGAIKKPGSLHKSLGVPMGEKIPAGKLEKASHASGKLGKRARLAMTLKGMK